MIEINGMRYRRDEAGAWRYVYTDGEGVEQVWSRPEHPHSADLLDEIERLQKQVATLSDPTKLAETLERFVNSQFEKARGK